MLINTSHVVYTLVVLSALVSATGVPTPTPMAAIARRGGDADPAVDAVEVRLEEKKGGAGGGGDGGGARPGVGEYSEASHPMPMLSLVC